ncbi:mannonate dehydratase [Belliella kenyensis]|uniref:Mannonate dehydratase n=1 Tax=Belliella kenyensis TaxID=1472724 RepID=A0ABV8EQ23_9BACT|nr:mannonate dehydratase [Belliella kenyensis]MCH7402014.1 mannonate dehydratase [Belliella kenyensis]MDN3605178.1 mannonate dehydratase [Belliella kenyensis]
MKNNLIQSWRWYGPNDPVSLSDIKQAGATAIVSALHHVPHGEVWTYEDIIKRKDEIESAGLRWAVVESVPVHEAIKTNSKDAPKYLENYNKSLVNLAKAGLRTVCYNFMPVLDWTRTDIAFSLKNGAKALYLDWADLAYFDIHMLQRANAADDYSPHVISILNNRLESYTPDKIQQLEEIICMGVPTEGMITIPQLRDSLDIYKHIGKQGLRDNLALFLNAIADTCESYGIQMTIHPDDPPYAILGLPRITSNAEDLQWIFDAVKQPFNGLCFCTGSLGAGPFNNLPEILKTFGERVHFVHLRNVKRDQFGNFHESDHLDGDVDMFEVMKVLVELNNQRKSPIPFRPDHGHQMLDDLQKETNPGYSAIGRLKGLAELRGLELGIARMSNSNHSVYTNDNIATFEN